MDGRVRDQLIGSTPLCVVEAQQGETIMVQVQGIDHLTISVGNFKKSKAFYTPLMRFLGFEILDEYPEAIGWTNGKTRLWIAAADAKGKKHKYRKGDIGFHHYALQLRSRKDVDALQAFLEKQGTEIVDLGRILRRLLRRVLSRSRRHEIRRHEIWRAPCKGRAGAPQTESEEKMRRV